MRGKKPVVPPLAAGEVIDLPSVQGRVPEAPSHLQGLARDVWDEIAGVLVARNLYDVDIRLTLLAYVIQYTRFLQADEVVQQEGMILAGKKGNRHGSGMYNPYLTLSNSSYDRMIKLASELGLTPVSRKRAVKAHRSVAKTGAMKFLKPV